MSQVRVKVAVPAPFFHAMDYLEGESALAPGCRVSVALGRRQVVGVVTETGVEPEQDESFKCKPVTACLDPQDSPSFSPALMKLCHWAARYYQYPIGEVFAAALPAHLRKPKPPVSRPSTARARKHSELDAPPELTVEQSKALEALAAVADGFMVSLIEGVTGSGKTEVYLARTRVALDSGAQVLVLTPEIGLTPQLYQRFRARFGEQVQVLHSGLGDKARTEVWRAARNGSCRVLIGTRSAVFAPLADLGLVIVDEEHDASYKQQEGFRYNARDVAVIRAQQSGIPVILGSATPSLESLYNVERERYQHIQLQQRAGQHNLPDIQLLDVRGQQLEHGISPQMMSAIERHLENEGQVLMFVNRRGYAPAVLCHDCGWVAPCPHCDARLTLHRRKGRLICHHCGTDTRVPVRCTTCKGTTLIPVGQGTERIDETLKERFPEARVERMDSDRARKAGELKRLLADIASRKIHIVVGTQMLAKGHDFAGLSLVGVVTADQALYSSDFRAVERMMQMLTQVSGRAGRGSLKGEVIVQTHEPEHPQLRAWLTQGYSGLARSLLTERQSAGLPPHAHLALLRADSLTESSALNFLKRVGELIPRGNVEVMGPVPAPMERRANRYRAQLLFRCQSRTRLQHMLSQISRKLDHVENARRIRWSIDVDPVDLF